MPHYLFQARYTTEAWKGLVSKPQDRARVVRKLCAAHGAKLDRIYFAFGDHDVVALFQAPDNKTAAAIAMEAAAGGAVVSATTTVLMTTAEAMDAAKMVNKVQSGYRPPGA